MNDISFKVRNFKHIRGVLLLAILLFIITSAGLYLLAAGVRKSINKEDPFFHYLYSTIVLILAIAFYIYIAYSDFLSSISNIEDVTFQFMALWLISSLIAAVFLIRNAVSKRSVVIPGVVTGIASSMFFMVLTLYISMVLL